MCLTQSTDTRGTVRTFAYGDAAEGLTVVSSYPSHPSLNVGITHDCYDRVADVTDGEERVHYYLRRPKR